MPRRSTQRFEVRGVVQKLRPEKPSAVIAHEIIPGYMEAMTMEFSAVDALELRGLKPGDLVAFRLVVTDTRSVIDHVTKIGEGSAPAPSSGNSPSPQIETPLPDCRLVDSQGTAFQLHDLRGQTLVLSFFFTRCPLPDFCPRTMNQLAAVREKMSTETNWRLVSISLDPDFDTPERLAAYAQGFHPDPARWVFASGERTEIERLGATFGLAVKRDGSLPNHNLRTVVIGLDGTIRKVFTGNEWSPEELAAELRRAALGN